VTPSAGSQRALQRLAIRWQPVRRQHHLDIAVQQWRQRLSNSLWAAPLGGPVNRQDKPLATVER